MHTNKLSGIIKYALGTYNMSDQHIKYVVDGLLETSLRGVDTHGIRLFETYIKELEGGRSIANPTINSEHIGPSIIKVDAGNALGLVAVQTATKLAIETARKSGVSVVSVKNSNHFGAASNSTRTAASAGFAGFCMSNADALMVPHNGVKKLLGTNPISFSAPAEGDEMFCLDMATSQIAYSKVMAMLNNGEKLKASWAIDSQGQDAEHSGIADALLPLGGYKGQGLAMMVQILAGLFNETPFDHEMSHVYNEPYTNPGKVGHFIIVLDISAFVDLKSFSKRLQTLMNIFRTSATVNNLQVHVPGDIEMSETKSRKQSGIPMTKKEFNYFTEWEKKLLSAEIAQS